MPDRSLTAYVAQDEMDPEVVLTSEHTCENIEWWQGRVLDWSLHARERSVERGMPFPERLPNKLKLKSDCGHSAWFISCFIEGVPLSIVAVPWFVCGKIVAKVITIYQYNRHRDKREHCRRAVSHIRHANHGHRRAKERITRNKVRAKVWQDDLN